MSSKLYEVKAKISVSPGFIRLVQTCGACPEQYDAFIGETKVGYLRLRHGEFRVDVPDCGGETIFEAEPEGDGIFESWERESYLSQARVAIATWLDDHPEILSGK